MSKKKLDISDSKIKDMKSGIVLVITFFVFSGFLYFNPLYLGNETISSLVILVFLCIGIVGLGIELNKLGDNKVKLGLDGLGLGLALGIIWFVIYYYFGNIVSNIITSPFLMFSIYAIADGFADISIILFSSKKELFIKIPIITAQITAFIAAIVTILNILGVV